MKCIALLATCLTPALALAECPTASDLDAGIRFKLTGGDIEEFKTLTQTTVVSNFYLNGVLDSRVLLARGLYITEYAPVVNGIPDMAGRSTYAYEVPLEQLPMPVPGGVFSAQMAVNDAGSLSAETDTYTFGEETQAQYGVCPYRMIPIKVTYSSDDTSVDELHWLPDLGVSYLAASTISGDRDAYTYVSIEKMK